MKNFFSSQGIVYHLIILIKNIYKINIWNLKNLLIKMQKNIIMN